MESALVSIVSVALIIIASVTMMLSSISSINSLMDSWIKMENEADEIRRTGISATFAENYTGGLIEMYISNDGQTNIGSFDEWDVITRYQSGGVSYINYTEDPSPDSNEWTVEGIFLSENTSVTEKFDPDILNPGESAKLIINLDKEIQAGGYGLVITSTDKGVTSQGLLHRQ
ncbi:MAG: hypothetical protein JW712_02955 [Dehalococcoidales bacterium]|nr:hypothetical protein [Dehalococcoidales bacterium]